MPLTLLHTAEVHVATFDRLRDRIAPTVPLAHMVEPDWLTEARVGVSDDLDHRLGTAIAKASGPVICTCTTLGPAAARHGAIRIDQPMMRQAARIGGTTVMAIALESTRTPSRDLFLDEGGDPGAVQILDLTALWPLFEDGNVPAFHLAVAGAVRKAAPTRGTGSVVLAQASMAGAAAFLEDLPVPVLTSPELALRAALSL